MADIVQNMELDKVINMVEVFPWTGGCRNACQDILGHLFGEELCKFKWPFACLGAGVGSNRYLCNTQIHPNYWRGCTIWFRNVSRL